MLCVVISTILVMATALSVADFLRLLFGNADEVPQVGGNLISQSLEKLYVWMIAEGPKRALWYFSLLLFLLYAAKNVFGYIASLIGGMVRNRVIRDIRNDMFAKSMRLKMNYYATHKEGDILSRFGGDVAEYEENVLISLQTLSNAAVSLMLYLLMLLYMDVRLTLVVLLSMPLVGLVISRLSRRLKKRSRSIQDQGSHLLSLTEEAVKGLRIIKAFNAIEFSNDRFRRLNKEYTQGRIKMYRRIDAASPVSEFLGSVIVVAVLLVGTIMVVNGTSRMSAEMFVSFLMLFVLTLSPAKNLSTAVAQIRRGRGCVERMKEFLYSEEEEKSNGIKEIESIGDIVFSDVTMGYGEEVVLRGFNLEIRRGEMVALVGPSGGGKSTVAKLLLRYYDIEKGRISVDGEDVNEYTLESWRGRIGLVSQESLLFNDTVANNIAYGCREATQAEIEQAAMAANAHDFIVHLPEGYNTMVGDDGGLLSGGQRQRLCIARAILRNPDIIVLDEATSALDSESEMQVQKGIEGVAKNCTMLVIAHRLSTIRTADKIVYIENGKVVEAGSHDELMAKEGLYYKLVKSGEEAEKE